MASFTTGSPLPAGCYDIVAGGRARVFIGVLPVHLPSGEYTLYGEWAS